MIGDIMQREDCKRFVKKYCGDTTFEDKLTGVLYDPFHYRDDVDDVIKLLNSISDKSDENAEKYMETLIKFSNFKKETAELERKATLYLLDNIEFWEVLRKHNISSIAMLDESLEYLFGLVSRYGGE